MIYKVFSIYDTKAEIHSLPYYAPNVSAGQRSFKAVVLQDDRIRGFPDDFKLYMLGEFDDANGTITMEARPHDLGFARSFLPRPEALPLFDQIKDGEDGAQNPERDGQPL